MPLTLTQIAANRASVTVTYAGQTVTLEYSPALITEKAIAEMSALSDSAARPATGDASDEANEDAARSLSEFSGMMGAINDLLCRIVLAWDVYEDDAQTVMFPLTPDRLADLPVEFRSLCLRAVFGGMRLGETNGTPSPAPSRATTRTATNSGSRR